MSLKKVVVLGAGESGVGAALLAKAKGLSVFVSDKNSIPSSFKNQLIAAHIEFEDGKHTFDIIFNDTDVIVKSPGIPGNVEVLKLAKEKNIEIVSEIEFASWYTDKKIIAITGSNGKTTTTKLTYHLLETAGFNVAIGGNYGKSFANLVITNDYDFYILEISSFQLDDIKKFKPNIAMLLNISPDHLDRYEYRIEKYIASKFRIELNQDSNDHFIYNVNNASITNYIHDNAYKIKAKEHKIAEEKGIVNNINAMGVTFSLANSRIKGVHNQFNATCALTAAMLVGADPELLQLGLDTFVNDAHRMELVATIHNVEYINDSKATNVDSTYYALQSMTRPTILILGGEEKGNDYAQIEALVKSKVKAIVCLGKDNSKIIGFFKNIEIKICDTNSAIDAIYECNKIAENGDCVLFSPACKSFDLFKNYIDRGDQFKKAVLNLND
jgi:UDP-N-acetylmuramoylalanine--D-glutamate ligase